MCDATDFNLSQTAKNAAYCIQFVISDLVEDAEYYLLNAMDPNLNIERDIDYSTEHDMFRRQFVSTLSDADLNTTDPFWIEYCTIEYMKRITGETK